MFEERQIFPVGSQAEEDKLYPYELLRYELYFLTRKDILQYNTFSDLISVKVSSEFWVVFRDKRKATAKYLSDINGAEITKKVSKAERVASWGINAINSISEIFHASSTVGLKVGGTIRIDHCAAEVKNRSKNDFGLRHSSLFTGRKCRNEQVDKPIGIFIFFQRSYKLLQF